MPEPAPLQSPSVFQLRVVLDGISPLIWRRLVVDASSTLDELHDVIQIAFAWSGDFAAQWRHDIRVEAIVAAEADHGDRG